MSALEQFKDTVPDYLLPLYKKKNIYQTYQKDRLQFGWKTKTLQMFGENSTKVRAIEYETPPIYRLDLREACRIIIIGATRSGKTFAMRSLGDRLIKTNHHVIYLTDIKDEFKSSRYPVQEKFRKLLMAKEKPEGLKVVTFRPSYFKNKNKDNYWFSIKLQEINKLDFMTLFDIDRLTDNQKIILEKIYLTIKNKDNFNMKDIEDILVNYNQNQIGTIQNKLEMVINSGLINPEYQRDLIKILNKGYHLSFNLEYFEEFKKGAIKYNETFLCVVLRNIIHARRKKLLKPVWVFIDEAPRFIKVNSNMSIQHEVKNSFDVDTRYGVNYAIATQSINDIDEKMQNQCKYIMIPYSATQKVIANCLISSAITSNTQRANNVAMGIKQNLKQYEWLIINKFTGEMDVIKPLSPLSNHAETVKF